MSSLSKEYREGRASFSKNKGRLLNPYPSNTKEHNDYEAGWKQAQNRSPNTYQNNFDDSRYYYRTNSEGELEKLPTLAEEEALKEQSRVADEYAKRSGR